MVFVQVDLVFLGSMTYYTIGKLVICNTEVWAKLEPGTNWKGSFLYLKQFENIEDWPGPHHRRKHIHLVLDWTGLHSPPNRD